MTKPSLKQILSIDNWSQNVLFVPIGLIIFYLIIEVDGLESSGGAEVVDITAVVRILTIVGLIVCLALLLWRIRIIRSAFETGLTVSGVIDGVQLNRRQGRVKFSFTNNGEDHQTFNAVVATPRVKALKKGKKVNVVIDSQNPNRTYISELYAE